jgi:hypothetical protein
LTHQEDAVAATSDTPLKVSKETKERVRLGAAILACTQGEFVDRAVARYLEENKGELQKRVEEVGGALLGDDADLAAYLNHQKP